MKTKEQFLNVVNIPEASVGEYNIRHDHFPADHVFLTANARCTIFGQKPKTLFYGRPTTWHSLNGPTGQWMTDHPCEQAQHDQALKKIKSGSVLVGGLGLGYAVTVLARKKAVKQVVVVEIAEEVIQLVAQSTIDNLTREQAAKVTVVHQDLFVFLRGLESKVRFDWAFYDIWQSDSEGTFFETVVPLLQASTGVVRREPICWNEDVMRGQLFHSLLYRATFTNPSVVASGKFKAHNYGSRAGLRELTGDHWHDWTAEFFKAVGDTEIDPKTEHGQRLLTMYCHLYGRENWVSAWHDWTRIVQNAVV